MLMKDYILMGKNAAFFMLIFTFSFILTGSISSKNSSFVLTVDDLPNVVEVGTEVVVKAKLTNNSLFMYEINYGSSAITIQVEEMADEEYVHFPDTTSLILPKDSIVKTRTIKFDTKGTYRILVISEFNINGKNLVYNKVQVVNVV